MENKTPQGFADEMLSKIGITPFWVAPTKPNILVNQISDPANPSVIIGGGQNSGFAGAARAALKALDPFNAPGSVSANIAAATAPVGKSAANVLNAGADTLKSAGGGIASGFKIATFVIVAGLALYVLALAGPFIPKPRSA